MNSTIEAIKTESSCEALIEIDGVRQWRSRSPERVPYEINAPLDRFSTLAEFAAWCRKVERLSR